MTNYNEKGRGDGTGPVDPLKAGKSPERISRPHRMSDTELKEQLSEEEAEEVPVEEIFLEICVREFSCQEREEQ